MNSDARPLKPDGSKQHSAQRVINLRALLMLLIIVGGTVVGMRKLHSRQFSRTVEFVRQAAYQAVTDGDYPAARLQMTRYLAMKRNDIPAQEKLSWLLSEKIGTHSALQQAFRLNEDLLRQGFDESQLRLRQAEIAVRLNQMADAEAHLKLLRSSRADDPRVWYLSGVTASAKRDTVAAIEYLKRSLRCREKVPEAFSLLAELSGDSATGEWTSEVLLARMTEECPSVEAWRIRAEWLLRENRPAEGIGYLWKALEKAPDDPRLNSMLVNCLKDLQATAVHNSARGQSSATDHEFQQAIGHFRERMEYNPEIPQFWLFLAAVLTQSDDRPEAIRILEAGIQKLPLAFQLHQTLIEYLVACGDTGKARQVFASLPERALPRDVSCFCEASILMTERRFKEAASRFEQAMAFAKQGSQVLSRAQLGLAICRSRIGGPGAAVEAFRGVIAGNPDLASARLGMAEAWERAGRPELAIAEYRQLLGNPGIAACLTDLLIQQNLALPAALRNWEEVDQLLLPENPQIHDPVQRALLRTDRLFASGQIVTAILTLEKTSRQFPDRVQVTSALKRLQSEYAPLLEVRLRKLIHENPRNAEAWAALAHLAFSLERQEDAFLILNELRNVRPDPENTEAPHGERPLLSQMIRLLIRMETLAGRTTYLRQLWQEDVDLSRGLAASNPRFESMLITALCASEQESDAVAWIQSTPVADPVARGLAILELVRAQPSRKQLLPVAGQQLFTLVSAHPHQFTLRLQYAELMLFGGFRTQAEEILESLESVPETAGEAFARRAWLKAVQDPDPTEAVELMSRAIQAAPQHPSVLESRARVLIAAEEFQEALRTIEQIPVSQRTGASELYRAAGLQGLNRTAEVFDSLEQLSDSGAAEMLLPDDETLYQTLQNRMERNSVSLR